MNTEYYVDVFYKSFKYLTVGFGFCIAILFSTYPLVPIILIGFDTLVYIFNDMKDFVPIYSHHTLRDIVQPSTSGYFYDKKGNVIAFLFIDVKCLKW